MKVSKTQKILAVVHDPGGTRSLLPVLIALRKKADVVVTVLCGPFASSILAEDGFIGLPSASNITLDEARQILATHSPDLLLTVTSWNSNLEQQLRNAAAELEIKSVVVLDFWTNPVERWEGATYSISNLPDIVYVMDEVFKEEMVRLGFRREALIVTGQPYLERLWHDNKNVANKQVKDNTFLFLSQPVELMGALQQDEHPLSIVIRSLDKYAASINQTCHLTVRLHPKEKVTALWPILTASHWSEKLNVSLSQRTVHIYDQIQEHKFILGYSSMGLFEARSFGKLALSLELVKIEPSVRRALGEFGIAVFSANDLNNLSCVLGEIENKPYPKNHQGAIEKIVSMIGSLHSEKSVSHR